MTRRLCSFLAVFLLTIVVLAYSSDAHAAPPPDCTRYRALALDVGWKKRDLPQLLKICKRESKGFARAWNRRDPYTGSYGLLQINGSWYGDLKRRGYVMAMTGLWHPRTNLTVALYIHRNYGWRPWNGNSN